MSDARIRACPDCGRCIAPEKLFDKLPIVVLLKAENADMLAALEELADCPWCINGDTIPEPCSGEAIGDCGACAPARKVLAKIKGESDE